MSDQADIGAVIHQLVTENRAYRLLLLSILRDKTVADLNRYIEESDVRVKLACQSPDPIQQQLFKGAGEDAKKMLKTLIAEKSASL